MNVATYSVAKVRISFHAIQAYHLGPFGTIDEEAKEVIVARSVVRALQTFCCI